MSTETENKGTPSTDGESLDKKIVAVEQISSTAAENASTPSTNETSSEKTEGINKDNEVVLRGNNPKISNSADGMEDILEKSILKNGEMDPVVMRRDSRDIEANDACDDNDFTYNGNRDGSNGSSENALVLDGSTSLSTQRTSVRPMPGAFAVENPMYESTIRQAILESSVSASVVTDANSGAIESQDDGLTGTATVTLSATTSESRRTGDNLEAGHHVVQAVCVDDQRVFEARVIPSTGSDTDPEQTRPSKIWIFTILIVVFLLTMVIVLSVVLSRQKRESGSDIERIPSAAPSGPPLELNYLQRTKALREIVAPFDDEGVFDENSSQFSPTRKAALDWLSSDKLVQRLEPNLEWRIRQRYVLALFYFSTNGSEWKEKYYFVSELNECDWQSVQTQNENSSKNDQQDFQIKGIFCNVDGKIDRMRLFWNGLTGTLPNELSNFSDSLIELDFAGGGMTGSIPPSFEKLTKLERLNISSHCLSGSIPDFSGVPKLQYLSLQENAELFGSLNWYCNGTDYKDIYSSSDMIADVIVDNCGGCSGGAQSLIECDCCTCCTSENFQCCSHRTGSFISLDSDKISPNGFVQQFEKQCISEAAKQWAKEECPCILNTNEGDKRDDLSFKERCTIDCDAEGAIPSHNFGSF